MTARTISSHRLVCADELLSALRCEPVVARAPVVLGRAPERRDPAAILEAVQGRVERAVLHLEHLVRPTLDRMRDGVAVCGPDTERLQDEQVERSLEELTLHGRRFHVSALASSLQKIIYLRDRPPCQGASHQLVLSSGPMVESKRAL